MQSDRSKRQFFSALREGIREGISQGKGQRPKSLQREPWRETLEALTPTLTAEPQCTHLLRKDVVNPMSSQKLLAGLEIYQLMKEGQISPAGQLALFLQNGQVVTKDR